MNRTLKQFAFGSAYLIIFAIAVAGIYFFYFSSAPSCVDNKQNQKEVATDCGGPCVPCETKGLNLVTEEARILPAGENQATVLARVRNPSQDFSASFSYKFDLGGAYLNQQGLRGRETVPPQKIQYIVIPGLPVNVGNINKVNLDISELTWSANRLPNLSVRVNNQSGADENRATVAGTLFNNSAANLPAVKLTALLFDKGGKVLNASITELEKVEAFSERPFIIFFPEIEGLTKNFDPQKTEVQWKLDDKGF